MDDEKLVEWLEKEIAKAKELREKVRRRPVAVVYYKARAKALEEVLDVVRRGQRPS